MVDLLPTDIAYSAGLFDGEGSVGIYRYGNAPGLAAQMSMTDLEPLEKLHRMYGGHIHKLRCLTKGAQVWHWVLRGEAASDMLRKMLPFLICKRTQAEVAITCPNSSVGKRLSPEMRAERLRLAAQLKTLKKKPQLEDQLEVPCGTA